MRLPQTGTVSSPGLSHQLRLSTLYHNGLERPETRAYSKANKASPGSSCTSRIVLSKLPKSRSKRAVEKLLQQRLVKKLRKAMTAQQKSQSFKVNSVTGTGSNLSHSHAQLSNRISVGSTFIVTHPTNRGQNRQTRLIVTNGLGNTAEAPAQRPDTPGPNTRFTLPAVNHIISPRLPSATTIGSEWDFAHDDDPLTADFPHQVNPTRIASMRVSDVLNIAQSHNRLDGVRSQRFARGDVRMSHAGAQPSRASRYQRAGPPQIPFVAKTAPLSLTGLEEPAQYYADQNDRRRTEHLATLSALEGGSGPGVGRDSVGSMPSYLAEFGVEIQAVKKEQQQPLETDPARDKGKKVGDLHVQDNLDAARQAINPADATPAPKHGTYHPYRSGVANIIPQAHHKIKLDGPRKIRQSRLASHYQQVEQLADVSIESRSTTSSSAYSQSTFRQSAAVPPLTPIRSVPQSAGSSQRKPLPKRPLVTGSSVKQPDDLTPTSPVADDFRPASNFSAYKHPRPAPQVPLVRHPAYTESIRRVSVINENGLPAYGLPIVEVQVVGQISSVAPPPQAGPPLPPSPPPPPAPQSCYTDAFGTHHVTGCTCSRTHDSSPKSNSNSSSGSRKPFWTPERKQKAKKITQDILVLIAKEKYRKPMWEVRLENDARAERKAKRKAEKKAEEARRAAEKWEIESARYAEARRLHQE